MKCICQRPPLSTTESTLLDTFPAVREECPAIKELFVPDVNWPKFRAWHLKSDEEAYHKSILLLALELGHLSSVTSSIHRYLLESGKIVSGVRRQYVMDLRENWMSYDDPIERHHKFKIFFGWLVELQCAEWLEGRGQKITALEAFREGPDIEATGEDQVHTAFEVKYIGRTTGDSTLF